MGGYSGRKDRENGNECQVVELEGTREGRLKSQVDWLRYRVIEARGRGLYSGFPDSKKCIFIHIPKCGGTSIAYALTGRESRHIRWKDYRDQNRQKFERYFKFAFVRNPWDRLASAFEFLKGGGMNEVDSRFADEHLSEYKTFDVFIKEGLNREHVSEWIHFKEQSWFISDRSGRVKVDFLGRLETIEEDFEFVCRRIGCENILPNLNRGKRSNYKEMYTQETWEIVRRHYEKDVALLNYGSWNFDGIS